MGQDRGFHQILGLFRATNGLCRRRHRIQSECSGSLWPSDIFPGRCVPVCLPDPKWRHPVLRALDADFEGTNASHFTMSTSTTRHFTSYGTINPPRKIPSRSSLQDDIDAPAPSHDNLNPRTLHRGLSSRQVQMIAIAGTIGTGLFLGTGRSLAQGGPASMLICYSIVGFIVHVTLLLLGEMATQYPVAGEYMRSRTFSGECFLSTRCPNQSQSLLVLKKIAPPIAAISDLILMSSD